MKKKILISSLITLGVLILLFVGYILYIVLQYSRIENNLICTDSIENQQETLVENNTMDGYSIITYNIGFGAYNHDFNFFMDEGVMKDGTKVKGKMSKAQNKETVLSNTNGSINVLSDYNPDFMFLQEVDTKSTRSYKVNQYQAIQEKFIDMASVHVSNFHSAYLAYPLFDNHGKSNSGIATFSKYKIENVIRKSLEITNAFPAKFFDLDRCFSVSYLPVTNGRYLVLINVHLSAYDEGGVYRKKQWEQLNEFLTYEYQKGNYVVCGGDFNHDIANSLNTFETKQEVPEWVYQLKQEDLCDNFRFATSNNVPTCRSTDMPYIKGENYSVVVDGFIISDNVEILELFNIDNDFKYSDHNPVYLRFKLL